jgi:hypothetical protein
MLLLWTATASAACRGPSLEELHRSLPEDAGPVEKWVDVRDVRVGRDGSVEVTGRLLLGSADGTCVVTGFSPGARRVWPGIIVSLDDTERLEFEYRFRFAESRSEPEPASGHYILSLACADRRQYVFVDFGTGAWMAD